MFLDLHVGRLVEPLSGRAWDRPEILRRVASRAVDYRAAGVTTGDRAFLHFGNSSQFFVDLVAIWSLGGCAIPIDSRFTPFEVETLAQWAKPRVSVWDGVPDDATASSLARLGVGIADASTAGRGEADAGAVATPLRLDQDALVLFTSGTTGQPKGVVHTHRSLLARWTGLREHLGVAPFRRTLCLLPTHFGHGLICNCLFPWLSGQDLYILPPFRPEIVARLGSLVDEHRITCMSSVPAIWRLAQRVAKAPNEGTLERVLVGSAPLSAALWETIQRWSGTRRVLNAYGITETASWLAGTTGPDFTPEDGLVGVAWGGVVRTLKSSDPLAPFERDAACAADEPGQVWVRTPALMRGYLDRDDLTERVVSGGWFLTGDIGVIDARGRLYLRGREREEINKGGMKVYPADVDAVIERFPATVDVCAFAFADPLLGEDIAVAVVLESNDPTTLRDLYRWTRSRLAPHQMPQRWYMVNEVPRTSRGKVSRPNVAEWCAASTPLDVSALLAGDST
jgi:acyl-CoA synthetase (AMP-forming)/AMP-acid ligase II